jgi:hypothetical protein
MRFETEAPFRIQTVVPVGDGTWSIAMETGRLERGDGRPFGSDESEGQDKGGLVPDIVAAASESGTAEAPESDPLVRGDAILTAALRRLREVLKATQ